MPTSAKSMRAAFVILSAVSSVAMSSVLTGTAVAASKNFAAKCEAVISSGSVKALAIEPTYSNQQICAGAATNREFRKKVGAAGIKCAENTITNFNQAALTPPDTTEPEAPTPPGLEPSLTGNNGWDNGGEGINNGSDNDNVAQADPKSADSNGQGDR